MMMIMLMVMTMLMAMMMMMMTWIGRGRSTFVRTREPQVFNIHYFLEMLEIYHQDDYYPHGSDPSSFK